MKEKNRIFAEALNKLMYEHHLSQNDLATKIGMTKSAISYWCRGERYPNEDGLNKLCKLFRCSRESLTKGKLSPIDYKVHTSSGDFIVECMGMLSDEGQQRLIEYAKDMVKIYGHEDSCE